MAGEGTAFWSPPRGKGSSSDVIVQILALPLPRQLPIFNSAVQAKARSQYTLEQLKSRLSRKNTNLCDMTCPHLDSIGMLINNNPAMMLLQAMAFC